MIFASKAALNTADGIAAASALKTAAAMALVSPATAATSSRNALRVRVGEAASISSMVGGEATANRRSATFSAARRTARALSIVGGHPGPRDSGPAARLESPEAVGLR